MSEAIRVVPTNAATSLPELLTAPEVAPLLRVTPARVYELAKSGLLPSVRLGRQVRFDPDELRRYIAGGGDPQLVRRERRANVPVQALRRAGGR